MSYAEGLLKVGDVVTLKSGSPKMTVLKINDDIITTFWFPFNVVENMYCPPDQGNFPALALERTTA